LAPTLKKQFIGEEKGIYDAEELEEESKLMKDYEYVMTGNIYKINMIKKEE